MTKAPSRWACEHTPYAAVLAAVVRNCHRDSVEREQIRETHLRDEAPQPRRSRCRDRKPRARSELGLGLQGDAVDWQKTAATARCNIHKRDLSLAVPAEVTACARCRHVRDGHSGCAARTPPSSCTHTSAQAGAPMAQAAHEHTLPLECFQLGVAPASQWAVLHLTN